MIGGDVSRGKKSIFLKVLYIWSAVLSLLLMIVNACSAVSWIRQYPLKTVAMFAAVFAVFALFLLLLAKSGIIMRIRSRKVFAAVLFLLSFISKAVFTLVIKTPQYSDFQLFYWVTAEIADGIQKYLTQTYYEIWAYQTGFPAAMAVFIKIFGKNVTALVLINCVFASLSNVLVYCLARLKAGEKTARTAGILYLVFPFVMGISNVYTNQHLATLLFYCGLYVLMKFPKSNVIAPAVCGLLLALGNGIRPEGILFVAAFAALLIYRFFADRGYKRGTRKAFLSGTALPVCTAVASYFICFMLLSNLFVITGLNPNGLKNNFPLYKFVVGLNHDTGGTFSSADSKALFESDIVTRSEERDAEALRLIRERLGQPKAKLARLFYSKINTMWTAQGIYPAFNPIMDKTAFRIGSISVSVRRLNTLFTFVDYLIYILLFGTILAGSAAGAAKNRETIRPYFVLLFSAAFAVYLFIEVQYRYSYLLMPALLIMLSDGLEVFASKTKDGKNEAEKRGKGSKAAAGAYR